jgi:hypothetical protein
MGERLYLYPSGGVDHHAGIRKDAMMVSLISGLLLPE